MKITIEVDKLPKNFTGICEYPDGNKVWCKNNKLHREDGPAAEWDDGDKEWYLNGKRHREDGPAIERSDGTKYWYMNGKQYTKEQFNKLTKSSRSGKTVEIDGKKYKLTEIS